MRLELTGRQVRITPTLRRLVEGCLDKLEHLLHNRAISLQVVLDVEKYRHRVEMTLHARGDHFLHGAGSGVDWERALTQAVGKVNQQARKIKEKWDDGKKRGGTVRNGGAEDISPAPTAPRAAAASRAPRVIRVRRSSVKPMSVEDAVAEFGDRADAVFVFRDAATDVVNVLFRRPDGNLGLIDPDA